jgi:hypothetical protein
VHQQGTGVVHQDVQPAVSGRELRGQGPDLIELAQVAEEVAGVDAGGGLGDGGERKLGPLLAAGRCCTEESHGPLSAELRS